MSINRNNYEEYFILYLDNELPLEIRSQVESFMQLHPDLKEELDLLMQYKLIPDTDIVFKGKEELLKKNAKSAINFINYPEWFTLYVDNELTGEEVNTIDQFILENPGLKKELLLTQKTKLQPEKIIFEYKASLYRKEESTRLIPLNWWKVAAAVILLLGISFAIYRVTNNKPASATEEGLAKTREQLNNTVKPVELNREKNAPVRELFAADKSETKVLPDKIVNKSLNSLVKVKNSRDDKKQKVILPVIKEETPLVADNNTSTSNNLPQPLNNPNIKNDALTIRDIQKENVNTGVALNEYVTNNSASPSNFKQATFKDASVFSQDENNNKTRGFFRKLTRTLEKRTNIDATDGDDKLLVAGLAIKLK